MYEERRGCKRSEETMRVYTRRGEERRGEEKREANRRKEKRIEEMRGENGALTSRDLKLSSSTSKVSVAPPLIFV